MKVLVTGSGGFIGKNLCMFLSEEKDIEILRYDRENTLEDLESFISSADAIVHLAGINRPQTADEFFSGNTDLTKNIIDILNEKKLHIPLIFSSSIQAALDNDYGKSKRLAEDYILNNYPEGVIYRLHNVFGKYCRPNYNSVVATFCNNIAHDEEIRVDNPDAPIELVYIDDICKTFIKILRGEAKIVKPYNSIEPVKKTTVGALADLIKSFKTNLAGISVPQTGDEFTKKLFSTYISYCDLTNLIISPEIHADERGAFSELIHTMESGQFSVSTSKPGITRGNHYHHTKVEKFIVVKGSAKISMRKIGEKEVHEFDVNGKNIQIITIPVGYTHIITNTGDDEMVLIIWCNELFDNNNPDTYYEEV